MSDIHTCPQLYVPVQMFKVEKNPVLTKNRAPEPGRGQQEVIRIPLSGPEFSHEVPITDSAPVDAPTVSQEDPRCDHTLFRGTYRPLVNPYVHR
jgi:hypothetical protein